MTRAYLLAVYGLLAAAAISAGSEPQPTAPKRQGEEAAKQGRAERERGLERALLQPVTVSFKECPLSKVIDDLQTLTGINMVIDRTALRESNIDLGTPVTLKVSGISLKSTLNIMLKQAGLTHVVKNEVVEITTAEVARGPIRAVSYAVADLVIPIGSEPPLPGVKRADARGKAGKTYEADLMKLITATVKPQSWSEYGGKGTIQFYPLGHGLVVSQTQDVQEQVQDLLAALRNYQEHHFKSYQVQVVAYSVDAAGRRQTVQWPRATVMLTQPVTVTQGAVVKLRNGSVKDLLGATCGFWNVSSAAEECEPPASAEELRVGKAYSVKLTRAEGMKLRLDVVMQENEVEEANRDGLTVTGQSVRAVRRVEPGKMVRVVLKREADGTDREWLELTVREPAAEADELPMPRKVGPAATEALPPDEFNPAHFNQAPARPAPAASPSTAR